MVLGEREACERMGYSRASFQRHRLRVLLPALDAPLEADRGLRSTRQQRRYEARQMARETTRKEKTRARRPSSLALSVFERHAILDAVHEPRFIDRSIPHIYATYLDEGRYLGSLSTMYRVVGAAGEVGERRNQATRPANVKPELCAVGPGRVWSWDITKLHGPRK
jgi:putative transposase